VKEVKIQEHIICEIYDQSKDVQINAFNQTKMDNILSPNHGSETNKHHPSL
jgi:hypothetical protein